jgi:SPP1 gp7 family putative phage head morphogenesis protein
MPTVPRPNTPQSRSNAKQPLPSGGTAKSQLEQTLQGDPKAIDTIKKSVLGRPQGPTTRAAATFVDWNKLAETLGQPFDAEAIPFTKLRQMRRDSMIGFGLHYVKTPLVRAPWKIEAKDASGPQPQVAAFIDAALRPIYARFIFQYCLSLDFGFSAIAKQFKMEIPAGTWIDENGNESPIWPDTNILPVIFKPFQALPPEECRPAFDDATGEFNGIIWHGANADDTQNKGGSSGAAGGAGQGGGEAPTVDVYHSLWATNEKDSVFGSIYGYPRIAYAYRYWWSYWYRWAQADRAFERFAVPPIKGWYPEGKFEDDDGTYDNLDVMLDAIDQIRANGGVALPSGVQEDSLGNKTNMREWDMEFLSSPLPDQAFKDTFDYLDVMKLRSVFIPEQAFLEGKGGTSSRNVASQMADVFIESQTNLMAEIDDHINRYVIPHLLVVNFPEFIGDCKKVTTGFSSDDIDFMKQMIQTVGGAHPELLPIDFRESLERIGAPVLNPNEANAQAAQLVQQSAASTPPLQAPAPGNLGVVPNANSVAGFSYIDGGAADLIGLSDDASFMSRLPNEPVWESDEMKRATTRLQAVWARYFAEVYGDFNGYIKGLNSTALADTTEQEKQDHVQRNLLAGLITAAAAKQVADRIVQGWSNNADRLAKLVTATTSLVRRMLTVAIRNEAKRARVKAKVTQDEIDVWTNERLGHLIVTTEDSIRNELTNVIADAVERGEDPDQISRTIQDHFRDFPQFKADRVARTESQTAYNTGTIFAARAAGAPQLLAHDASDGEDTSTDEECKDRNGTLFDHAQALRENEDEHPNGTLYFTIVPHDQPVDVDIMAADETEYAARFDADSNTVYFSDEFSLEDRAEYMKTLVASWRST